MSEGNLRSFAGLWSFDVAVQPTVSVGVYAAGDIVGGVLDFASLAPAADLGFRLRLAQVSYKAGTIASPLLVLLNAAPSGSNNDNDPFGIAAADIAKVVAVLPLVGAESLQLGTPRFYSLRLDLPLLPAAGGRNLKGLLVDQNGFSLAGTSDVRVRLAGTGV